MVQYPLFVSNLSFGEFVSLYMTSLLLEIYLVS